MYVAYFASLVASAAIAAALAVYLWNRRSMPGASPAAWLMLAIVVVSLGYILQYQSTELSGQIFATNIQYVGIVAVPVTWFAFSAQYTGRDKWLRRRNLLLLAVVPFITLLLAWSNSSHGLIWQDRHLEAFGPFMGIGKTYGPWFWLHTSYSYLLVLLAVYFLFQRLFRRPRLYRQQAISLTIAGFIPLAFNVLYIFQLTPLLRVDLAPSAFTISGLVIAWGLFRFRLMDIVPVARDTVIEGMRDGIIVLDTQNRLVDTNAAAQRIIGYPSSYAIGKPVERILSRQARILDLLHDAKEAWAEIVLEKNGEQLYYESRVSPLFDRRRRLVGRLIVLHDITEHKEAEARNKALEEKAELASRLAAIGEMASGIAHEINNPLTAVAGYAEWLLERDVPEGIRGNLESIHKGAKRISDITSRLLSFAGRRAMKREQVDINHAVETALELRGHSLENNNVEVVCRFDPDLPRTLADSGQLQEVFLNLIINAETSMKEAHGGGTLRIKTETLDGRLLIAFQDDGPGIAKENLERVFEPFFTTKDVGEGTGLGLSLSHGIIDKHDGTIRVRSELGRGATFFVELPIVVGDETPGIEESIAEELIELVKASILVVDDEPETLKLLSTFLSKDGHEVETAGNAVNALEKLEGKQYDLVLLDIKMPNTSGIELYYQLKETNPSAAGRVVFITGDIIGADTMQFLSAAETPYITKPFDLRRLRWDIYRLLTKTR